MLFFGLAAGAQQLRVEVYASGGKPLQALIQAGSGNESIRVETDSLGQASIPLSLSGRRLKIVAHSPGFVSDSLVTESETVLRFFLEPEKELPEVEVQAQAQAAFLEKTAVIKTEVINRTELKKAACCDLAGCFETQGTVQPQVSNVLSNAKELRILGLSGVYNQLLVDGMPTLLGLSFPYGVSGIPGPMVENIYVSKGTNSVLQGFESISGQINVLTTNAAAADKLRASYYINQFAERHFNAAISQKTERHAVVYGIHLVDPAGRRDRDGDGFLDVTRLQRKMAFVNGSWNGEKFSGEYGVRSSLESRNSGQYSYDPEKDQGSTRIYGQTVGFNQTDIRQKTEYRYRDNQRIILQTAAQLHRQDSWFGNLHYRGRQWIGYGNIQHEIIWSGHILRSGFSQRLLDAREEITLPSDPVQRSFAGNYRKYEIIPGIFAENTFSFRGDRLKLIAGIRADHHNRFGWQVVPRMMLRADFSENSIFRMNAGRGWRTLNLFTDHGQILAGNRNLQIQPGLLPELAWNAGMSYTRNFESPSFNGYLSADAYYTWFNNQLFPEYEASGTQIVFRNFGESPRKGNAAATSESFYAQLEGKFNLNAAGLSMRFSYSYTENFRTLQGEKTILPFTPLHRGLAAVSWKPPGTRWQFDFTQHLYGSQYLPDTRQNPEAYRNPEKSPAYQILNFQVIRFFKKLELYAGCENILDFRQLRPITAWQEPFSPWFDTAGVWGPTRGRELYAGLRFRIAGD